MPEVLLGFPLYNKQNATIYIINKLTGNGFSVQNNNYVLDISWAPKDISSVKLQNMRNEANQNIYNSKFS